MELTSGEAEDLRQTDLKIATSEEEHAQYAKLHPQVTEKVENKETAAAEQKGTKDQVENIQEVSSQLSDLEEQYNRWVFN